MLDDIVLSLYMGKNIYTQEEHLRFGGNTGTQSGRIFDAHISAK